MADCDFGTHENLHLAVRLVCGCFSHETQKKLLALPKIDLDEVVRLMQADESASHSQVVIRGGQSVIYRLAHKPSLQKGNTKQPGMLNCTNCGGRGHRAKDTTCPALDQTLHLLRGKHFTPITAEVDTGAQIPAVTEATYRRHFAHLPLLPAATLQNFDNTVLSGRSLGRFLTQSKTRTDESCLLANVSTNSIPLPESPWQKVAIDVTGPFLIAPQSSKFLVVIIDYKSEFLEILMASNVRSSTIIGWLDEIVSQFGAPDELVSDNGP
ncbi:integrase core domain protein [Plakobranchus ocellatus]|uniref:Integrase core domain protein n=1 Tax=Plakobranchus ocellatus TaxID=259542 RepID=A0AAV4CT99_9GAST|nr:integrase core domain protein [Plakobranchus ocellatus]